MCVTKVSSQLGPQKFETRTFQSCRISCQGRDQSMPAGGPTTRRSSLRCATSSAVSSCLKIFRWPAAKHATGVTTAWKNVRRSLTEIWWFVRIERFAWKARDAACNWCCRSALGFPPCAAWSMHPSHLWAHRLSSISTVTPPLVCKELPGWACVVKIFVFDVFSVKPTWPRDVTNSSNSRIVSSRLVANTKRSSANRRSKRAFLSMSMSMSMPMSMSTLYAPLGSLFQAQGENCETTSYIHHHLQKSKNAGRFERQNPTSIAETSLTQSRPSQQNCYGPQGTWEKNSIIMVLNKIAQKPVHGTTIVPHDGHQSSMMNEKHVQKKTRSWSSHRFGGRPGRLRGCTWKFLS